jgi:hypothetical protein
MNRGPPVSASDQQNFYVGTMNAYRVEHPLVKNGGEEFTQTGLRKREEQNCLYVWQPTHPHCHVGTRGTCRLF